MKDSLISIMWFLLAYIPAFLSVVFFFLAMLAHPQSVAYIISQVETPLVIRMGGVIITYPILFAVLLLSSKLLDDGEEDKDKDKDQDEDKDKDKDKESHDVWLSIVCILLCLPLLLLFGSDAWQKLQLRHQLLQEGISGVATVKRCEEKKGSRGGSSCYVSYEYKLANHSSKSYRVREQISCAKVCHIGSSVDIAYLSQTPSKAGIVGNTHGLERSVFWFTFLFNVFILPVTASFYTLINWVLTKWPIRSPEEPKEVEITQKPSLKDKPFKLDKQGPIIEALRIDPQNARAWLVLGWMMVEEGKPEQTRECYERAFNINLQFYEVGELSAEELPTWVDLVTAEEEMPLVLEDVYRSSQNHRLPLPNWLDEEEIPSFFSRLLAIRLFMLFLSLMIIFLPGGVVLSIIFFGDGSLSLFLSYFWAITMTIPVLMAIFHMLKLIQVSIDSRHWPESSAIVIGSFVKSWKSDSGKSKGTRYHSLYVVCAYQVDQQIYYSTVPSKNIDLIAPSYQSGINESDDFFLQKEKEYKFGKRMTVFYNPRQPHIIFHQVGFNRDTIGSLIGMMGLALFFGLPSYALWQALLRSAS